MVSGESQPQAWGPREVGALAGSRVPSPAAREGLKFTDLASAAVPTHSPISSHVSSVIQQRFFRVPVNVKGLVRDLQMLNGKELP